MVFCMNASSKSKVLVLAIALMVVTLGAGSVAGASGGSATSSVPAKHAPAKSGLPAVTPLRALNGRVIALNLKGVSLIVLAKLAPRARYVVTSTPAGVVGYGIIKSGTEQAPGVIALKVGRAAVTLRSTGGGGAITFTAVVTSRAPKPAVSGPPFRSLSSLNGRVQHLTMSSNNGILLQALPGRARYLLRATKGGVVELAVTRISGRVVPLLVALRIGATSVTLTNSATKQHASFAVSIRK